tara:strand:- start:4656 stop:5525 length:870 start_codon:yes stop_codon:yes gene_type:complete
MSQLPDLSDSSVKSDPESQIEALDASVLQSPYILQQLFSIPREKPVTYFETPSAKVMIWPTGVGSLQGCMVVQNNSAGLANVNECLTLVRDHNAAFQTTQEFRKNYKDIKKTENDTPENYLIQFYCNQYTVTLQDAYEGLLPDVENPVNAWFYGVEPRNVSTSTNDIQSKEYHGTSWQTLSRELKLGGSELEQDNYMRFPASTITTRMKRLNEMHPMLCAFRLHHMIQTLPRVTYPPMDLTSKLRYQTDNRTSLHDVKMLVRRLCPIASEGLPLPMRVKFQFPVMRLRL